MKEICTQCQGVACFDNLFIGRTKFDTENMRVEKLKERIKDCEVKEVEKDTDELIRNAGALK